MPHQPPSTLAVVRVPFFTQFIDTTGKDIARYASVARHASAFKHLFMARPCRRCCFPRHIAETFPDVFSCPIARPSNIVKRLTLINKPLASSQYRRVFRFRIYTPSCRYMALVKTVLRTRRLTILTPQPFRSFPCFLHRYVS